MSQLEKHRAGSTDNESNVDSSGGGEGEAQDKVRANQGEAVRSGTGKEIGPNPKLQPV
jgi:hypothetical protein